MNIAEDMKKVTTNYTVKEDMIYSKIPIFLQSLSLWHLLGSISIIKSTKKFYFLCKPPGNFIHKSFNMYHQKIRICFWHKDTVNVILSSINIFSSYHLICSPHLSFSNCIKNVFFSWMIYLIQEAHEVHSYYHTYYIICSILI